MRGRPIGILVLALPLLAVAGARADEWTKSYAIQARADVRVEANDGHVRIGTWDRKEVSLRVETVGWRISDDEVRVSANQSGDRISLDVREPRFRWDWGVSGNRSIRIELQIPREADLDVHTGDGHVTLGPLNGTVRIRTGDGHITLDRVRGDIRLATGDGHIQATALDGRLDAATNDGHMTVDGRFDLLNLRTGDGRIEARAELGSKMASSWTLRTGDGSIMLRVPQGFAADVDAETGDGRISLGFPVNVSGAISRSSVRGKMNGGGPLLTLRSGDGSISLDRL